MFHCCRRVALTGSCTSSSLFIQNATRATSLLGTRAVSSSFICNSDDMKGLSVMPGPTKVPLLGNLFQMQKAGGLHKFNHALQLFQKQYGKIFQLKLGPERMVVISDPDLIEEVYRQEGKYPRREKSFPAWSRYHKKHNVPEGVFLMNDEDWHRHRSALNPKLLNIKQVEHYSPDFNVVIDKLMIKLLSMRNRDFEIENIEKQLFRWSLESVCTVLFEKHIGCFSRHSDPKYEEFIDAVQVLFDVIFDLVFQPPFIDKIMETKPVKDLNKCMDTIYSVADNEVKERIKVFDEKHGGKIDEDTAKEFIPYLYYVAEMNLADIKSDISSLMMAAVDTTSTSMQMLLFNLANNQKVQTKLHEEISQFLKPDEPATPEILKKMPYMRAVMKESMRLHAVVPFNARWFTEDKNIAGYKIPANTWMFLLHDVVSHQKEQFEDPDVFKPKRWLREEKEEHKIHPFASLPFGYGVRMCLGRRLAELEIQLLLARIFGKYVVECDQKKVVMSLSNAINKPDVPLKFKFYER